MESRVGATGTPATRDARRRSHRRRETDDRIAAAARRLFARHGFAGVTVARISTAAGVSTTTVSHHFPAKEAIFFAGAPPVDSRLLRVVAGRPAGESAYEAIRRHVDTHGVTYGDVPAGLARAVRERGAGLTVLEAIRRHRDHADDHPAGDDPRAADLARVYLDSADLRSYAREQFARQERALADLLAADTGGADDDPLPGVVASALLAPHRWVFDAGQRWLAAGEPPAAVARRRAVALTDAYRQLAVGVGDYARRGSSAEVSGAGSSEGPGGSEGAGGSEGPGAPGRSSSPPPRDTVIPPGR